MARAKFATVNSWSTPSQIWARSFEACIGGRRRLGLMSIAEYFRTVTGEWATTDMMWIARRLRPAHHAYPSEPYATRVARYETAVDSAECFGRWGVQHTREHLIQLFTEFEVTMPAELL